MGIKTYNPYTPSRRNMTGSDFSEITASTPEKSLVVSLKKNAGRNNQGKITVRHQGGGSRRKYRLVDFKRNKDGIPATVKTIEYDPNRTANIALICYADGQKSYILAPNGLKVGQTVMNGPEAEVKVVLTSGRVLDKKDENIILSARNLPEVRTTLSGNVNVYDVLKYDSLVITKEAVAQIEEVYA